MNLISHNSMKTTPTLLAITSVSATFAFICSYFWNITMTNSNQYLAIVGVMFLDGVFGMIAGCKREGFQTRKAIKVLRNTVAWLVILTVILMVEQGFAGTAWLSEVIVVPFMVFQLISALKNASMAGFIQMSLLNQILDKIDKHKGIRDEEPKE
jgi:phage-related holin